MKTLHTKTIVKSNAYFDSVTLMKISGEVSKLNGVIEVLVGMGTELNKDSLRHVGLLSKDCETASPNDLMIGISTENEEALNNALNKIEDLLSNRGKKKSQGNEKSFERIEEAARLDAGYNMAVISVPGIYAAREAKIALENNMNVFLFSDNVTVEEEIELKNLANEKGLLMMGPDCGTAIINGVPLGFANRVRRGNIGIVGASGTGLQQVTTLIHSFGGGVSQAIGTGGRDLSAKVSGRTMLSALEALKEDEETKVVVIISKPPAAEVAYKVFSCAENLNKPVVLCLLGSKDMEVTGKNIIKCSNLEETAAKAVSLSLEKEIITENSEDFSTALAEFKAARKPNQKYIRAIYGGGTLCDEAMTVFRRKGIPMFSNIPFDKREELSNIEISQGNCFLDMGDDFFTRGKPHPMIEPSLRNKRIVQEALDSETAVILLDVELGHGSHIDPAGIAAEAAAIANIKLDAQKRKVFWIAALVGTKEDPQNYEEQVKKLKDAGFVVFDSNVRAASLAAELTLGFEGGSGLWQ
ncbi:acyl-CoA synthetase FdrA [Clostridium sp. YIM B02515]|uniref:Acyl-CoA synthetase FdrA n=1 Tax=Clostridium rhizosphaerae TaxID=2803861 RepID=A0ABS1T7J3_9CLOT|nr:acyl-CoA synthetase FdrA [Clostridium rhizosphaerae]